MNTKQVLLRKKLNDAICSTSKKVSTGLDLGQSRRQTYVQIQACRHGWSQTNKQTSINQSIKNTGIFKINFHWFDVELLNNQWTTEKSKSFSQLHCRWLVEMFIFYCETSLLKIINLCLPSTRQIRNLWKLPLKSLYNHTECH